MPILKSLNKTKSNIFLFVNLTLVLESNRRRLIFAGGGRVPPPTAIYRPAINRRPQGVANMFKSLIKDAGCLLAALTLFFAIPVGSASAAPLTLKLGHTAAPSQACAVSVRDMAKVVAEKTGGQVVIEVYENSALGEEDELLESSIMGTVDMFFGSGASLSGLVPEFMITDMPFPFGTPEEAYAFYDGEIGDLLFQKIETVGLVGLSYLENGFRNMTNNVRAIHTPADMAGLKMRTMSSPVYMAMMKALGASPTPIPYGELYTALQQKTVDGQENPVTNIESAKFYEVQKFITLTRHSYDPNILLMSKKTRDKLTAEQFQIIKEAALAASRESRLANNAAEEETLKMFEKAGLEVTRLNEAERKQFVEATQPIYAQFADKIGAEFFKKYMTALGR